MQSLPLEFRAKHDQLLGVVDSRTGKPVTDSLGPPSHNLEPHPSGGARFPFTGGSIYTFDHTGRFPVVAVWGEIYRFYNRLANFGGGFGRPLTDVTDLQDGGRCCIFEGGHLHEYGQKVEPFPALRCVAQYQPPVPPFPFGIGPAGMPAAFHQKWISLSLQKDPNGQSIIEHLGVPNLKLNQNANGGQIYNFLGGELVTFDNQFPPVVCYGVFNSLWSNVGHVTGGLGHPLADAQDIEGGRCQIFQGGHIHHIGDSVHTASPEKCTTSYTIMSPPSWNTMPPHFQRKWTALCSVTHPHTRNIIAESRPCLLLRDNPKGLGGQNFNFLGGDLVSLSMNPDATPFSKPPMAAYSTMNAYSHYPPNGSPAGYPNYSSSARPPPSHPFDGVVDRNNPYGAHGMPSPLPPLGPPSYNHGFPDGPQYVPGLGPPEGEKPLVLTEPFYVTGVIAQFWRKAGGIESTYGRPLCDEQDLPDGGRCSIFEGSHIHLYNGEARGIPAQHCTAPYQPTAPARSPTLAAWPTQPGPQSAMTIPPVSQDNNPESDGGCMALLKLCRCNVETSGRSGVCKCGNCVCLTCLW